MADNKSDWSDWSDENPNSPNNSNPNGVGGDSQPSFGYGAPGEPPRYSAEDNIAYQSGGRHPLGQEPLNPYGSPQSTPYGAAQPDPYGEPLSQGGVPLVYGNGELAVGLTASKSLKLTMKNFGTWLLGGLAYLGASIGFGVLIGRLFGGLALSNPDLMPADANPESTPPLWFTLLIGLFVTPLVAVLMVYASNGALRSARGELFPFRDFFRLDHGFSRPFTGMVVIAFVSQIPSLLIQGSDSGFVLLLALMLLLVAVFISPLIYLWVPALIASEMTVGQALSQSIALGKQHYLPLLGLVGINLLFSLAMALTLGLAGFILIPAMMIMGVLAYLQLAGGVHERIDV